MAPSAFAVRLSQVDRRSTTSASICRAGSRCVVVFGIKGNTADSNQLSVVLFGVVSGAISTHYEISITAATASFSYLTTGVLAGSFLSMLVNPLLGSRRTH